MDPLITDSYRGVVHHYLSLPYWTVELDRSGQVPGVAIRVLDLETGSHPGVTLHLHIVIISRRAATDRGGPAGDSELYKRTIIDDG